MKWAGNKDQQGAKDIEAEVIGAEGATRKKITVETGTTIADVRKALDIPTDYNAVRAKTNEQLGDTFDAGTLETGEILEFSMPSKLGLIGL